MRGLAAVTVLVGVVAATSAPAASSPAPGDAVLLARHLPVLVLHRAEPSPPVAVDAFLAGSDALVQAPDGTFRPASAGETPTRLDVRGCAAAVGPPGSACYQPLAAGPPTAYGAVHRRRSRIVLQYWLFWPVNVWSPVVPAAADAWQVHEGDWEHVALVLDARGRPLHAGYAQHCAGVRIPWSSVPRQRGAERPVVHVGLGSHASYAKPGVQPTDPKCWRDPKVVVPIFTALGYRLVDHAGGGRRITELRLVRLTSTSPAWTSFAGTWGEDRYVRLGQVAFKDGAGPIGPTHKRAWREPLAAVAAWPLTR